MYQGHLSQVLTPLINENNAKKCLFFMGINKLMKTMQIRIEANYDPVGTLYT